MLLHFHNNLQKISYLYTSWIRWGLDNKANNIFFYSYGGKKINIFIAYLINLQKQKIWGMKRAEHTQIICLIPSPMLAFGEKFNILLYTVKKNFFFKLTLDRMQGRGRGTLIGILCMACALTGNCGRPFGAIE